jgi:hypothetical protein
LDDKELDIRRKLKNDFQHYAEKCLSIRTKSGKIEPLTLNESQRYIHRKIEDQRAKTGKVRAVILKGRQQGCSTYVEGRFYWRVTHSKGVRAFILTHEEEATANLFELAKRYHDNCPAAVKPQTGASSAKELYFSLLDSGYKVGTAGNKAVGRSSTVQFFHGSEVGFWPNAQQHAAGILQAIPDEDGTEVILESTANGLGNFFHEQWQKAESGQSDYVAIFVPWYWQPEYRKVLPDDFKLTDEESEYMQMYSLDPQQINWRRNKIVELNDPVLFKQEYPATSAEAFQVSGLDPLIKPDKVLKARKATGIEAFGAKALGVDPARFGDDRTSITLRQGRTVHWQKSYSKQDTMQVAGIVATMIKDNSLASYNGDRVFIDVGGLGAGVFDRLRELVSDRALLVSVNFGGSPINANKYRNKRAEIWGEMREWFDNEPCSVPDSDELHTDLTQVRYKYDSNSALEIEKKEDMKKRGLRSPDCGDSLALTFSQPLSVPKPAASSRPRVAGSWMG